MFKVRVVWNYERTRVYFPRFIQIGTFLIHGIIIWYIWQNPFQYLSVYKQIHNDDSKFSKGTSTVLDIYQVFSSCQGWIAMVNFL